MTPFDGFLHRRTVITGKGVIVPVLHASLMFLAFVCLLTCVRDCDCCCDHEFCCDCGRVRVIVVVAVNVVVIQ